VRELPHMERRDAEICERIPLIAFEMFPLVLFGDKSSCGKNALFSLMPARVEIACKHKRSVCEKFKGIELAGGKA